MRLPSNSSKKKTSIVLPSFHEFKHSTYSELKSRFFLSSAETQQLKYLVRQYGASTGFRYLVNCLQYKGVIIENKNPNMSRPGRKSIPEPCPTCGADAYCKMATPRPRGMYKRWHCTECDNRFSTWT
jgi:hypothetical protein